MKYDNAGSVVLQSKSDWVLNQQCEGNNQYELSLYLLKFEFYYSVYYGAEVRGTDWYGLPLPENFSPHHAEYRNQIVGVINNLHQDIVIVTNCTALKYPMLWKPF